MIMAMIHHEDGRMERFPSSEWDRVWGADVYHRVYVLLDRTHLPVSEVPGVTKMGVAVMKDF
jgi:hypothetical protein